MGKSGGGWLTVSSLVFALVSSAAGVAEAGTTLRGKDDYVLEVDARTRWGCSRGGGTRTLKGKVTLKLRGKTSTLQVRLGGSSIRYSRYYGRGRVARRPHVVRSSIGLNRRFAGQVTWARGAKAFEVSLRPHPRPKGNATPLTLQCRFATLAVFPAKARTIAGPQKGALKVQRQGLRCTASGRIPHLLRDAMPKKELRLGSVPGITVVAAGRWRTSHGAYYAR